MRHRFLALLVALTCVAAPAPAEVNVHIGIGVQVPVYPQLVLVPGHPVYYAPQLRANFFFFDGLYWVLEGEHWAVSAWFNGPWEVVPPARVPYPLLLVPVRYYRAPPPWFRGWDPRHAPRWASHWGPQWQQEHKAWNDRSRRPVPPPAPLPSYQRRYSGDRYPPPPQQADLQNRNYRYQPRTDVARDHYDKQRAQREQRAERGAPGLSRGAPARPPEPGRRDAPRDERRQAH